VENDLNHLTYNEVYPLYVEWEDGYLKSDGSIFEETTYKTSSLIHIPAGYQLVFNSYASNNTYHYCNYDAAGVFENVSATTGLNNRNGIKIDAIDDRWVKICTKVTEINIEQCDPHLLKLQNKATTIADISNILDINMVEFVSGYLSPTTHIRVNSDVYYCTSQIFLQKGQTIEYKCSGSSNSVLLMEVTCDYSYVASLVVGDGDYHRLVYTADHDMYVRICSRTASGGNYVPLEEFKDVKFYYKSLYHSEEKLKDKNIVVIGDSLIYGNLLGNEVTWCKILENATGATVYNYGINGNTISSVSGANESPMSVRYASIGEISDADIIIVEGGANDKNQNCPIGMITDTTNDTFIGACNVLIDELRAINPTANILFMTTYHRYSNKNTLGFREKDYADAMLLACGNKGIPCFDNSMNSGISFLDTNLKSWCDEGIYLEKESNQHFSPKGYEWLYPKYKYWIESQLI
jgi:lysophospholipase L1-like esterase